jgi:tetratricopeptide (TPR) repeat protein
VEGKPLKAGVYGLHMVPGQDEWIVIFSNNSTNWGSFFYTPDEDALRVTVKPIQSEFNEWLTFNFVDRFQNNCTLLLKWENLSIPVKMSVPNGDELFVQKINEEAQGSMGFQGPQFMVWQNWVQAANYCASKKINLDEAFSWLENYLNQGLKYFTLLQSKGNVLIAMGRQQEADEIMREAIKLPDASARQITNYGRTLLSQSRAKEAMEVLEFNWKRYSSQSAAAMGMAYGYSATGDFKKAIRFAKDAYANESNSLLKSNIEVAIDMLANGKDIN